MQLYGLKIRVAKFCTTGKWLFPKHRFFEWEPKDEAFCRKYGIGRPEPGCYQFGDTIIMHPEIYEQLKDVLPKPENDPFLPLLMDPRTVIMNAF